MSSSNSQNINNQIIKAGELFITFDGEYSDYAESGLFKALKDLDMSILLDAWAEEQSIPPVSKYAISPCNKYYDDTNMSKMSFLAWLIKNLFCEELNYRNVWMGSYGRVTAIPGDTHERLWLTEEANRLTDYTDYEEYSGSDDD